MKIIRYAQSFFHVVAGGTSEAKYEAGKYYPVDDETRRHAAIGIAEEVDAPEDVEKAIAAAEAAKARAEKATESASTAQAAADVAAASADAATAAATITAQAEA